MGATAAIGMIALGTGMSAYGQLQSGKDAQGVANRNAQFAEYQAQDAEVRGKADEKVARRQTEQVIGAQRTSFAAQGIDINRGSALTTQADAAYLGELDALTIKNNAAKEAWGYRTQAEDYRRGGQIARRSSQFGAFQTVVGSAGSLLLAQYGGGYGSGRGASGRSGGAQDLNFDPARAGR